MSQCCAVPTKSGETSAVCNVCGHKGKPVLKMTPEHLLFEQQASQLSDVQYHFCMTQDCDVVYFSNASGQYFRKQDVRVRVGSKESDDPIPVCYCFNFTQAKIFDEIRTTGHSTAAAEITQKVKAGKCQCEIKNPSGRCCLGEVNRTVKQGIELFAREVATVEP
ncbi:MAG: hypothetical protein ACE5IR_20590 [bacterium]